MRRALAGWVVTLLAATQLAASAPRAPAAWTLDRDPATGRARRWTGGALELDPSVAVQDGVLAVLRERERALDLRIEDLRLAACDAPFPASAGRPLVVVRFDVAPGGVPVEGGRVTAVVAGARLLHVDLVGTGPVAADPRPRLEAGDASRIAIARGAGAGAAPVLAGEPALAFLPRPGGSHALAWKVTTREPSVPRRTVTFVDARSGEVIERRDETVSACAPPAGVERRVLGAVRPEGAHDPERAELLPSVVIGGAVAGDDGFFVPGPPPDAAALEGPVARVDCVGCASPAIAAATAGPTGDVDFGSGGADEVGNGTSTPAARSAYFHVAAIRALAARRLALPFLAQPAQVHVNLPGSCNAHWDGHALAFFRSSARCANTAEVRDVVVHEWGHALDEHDGQAPSSVTIDAATGEAAADVLAMLRSRDPCIGESFHAAPLDWPSDACSGVRDLDERAPGHRRGTLDASNVDPLCPAHPGYRGTYGREGHCEGELLGQAWWHLVQDLLAGASYADGSPLAIPALAEDQAWDLAESLYFRSRPLLAALAPARDQSIGISAHDALLLADDEGDGIGNGTPHAAAIHDALAHHGLAEAPLPPPAGAPCAAPADPAVTVTLDEDPASGHPALRVDWSDTGGARHHVLRADGPGEAYLPLGAPAGAGAGSRLDRGVLPGRTYRYRVVAEDAAGCPSPGAAPASASAGPILRVAGVAIDDAALGDGDGLLEPGETADASVTVENIGTVRATDVRVTLASGAPGLVALVAGPTTFGDVPAGARVAGPSPFTLRADPGVPRLAALTATGEAVEGCFRGEWLLELGVVDLALAGRALDDGAGNADGAWDAGEDVVLAIDLRQDGPVTADPVAATLALRSPVAGVAVTRAAASWAPLAARATGTSLGPHFALTAGPGVAPRTVVPLRLDVDVGGTAHRAFDFDLAIGGVAPATEQWADARAYMATTPIVVQLTDDDGDGDVTGCDVADVVLTRWTGSTIAVRAVHGDTGALLWEQASPLAFLATGAVPAAGDVDGDGVAEIVVGNRHGFVSALRASDGSILWTTAQPVQAGQQWRPQSSLSPVIADLEGDGRVEVVAGYTVLAGADGSVVWERLVDNKGHVLVADLDLDGSLEIIGGTDWDPRNVDSRTWRADGTPYGVRFDGYTWGGGIANLDADPHPEVAWLTPFSTLRAWNHDGTPVFPDVTFSPTQTGGTASPCFADLDADGRAEVALPIADQLWMVDDDGSVAWTAPFAGDFFDACSTFDFDRDALPEVVVRDEAALRVHDGRTGDVLWEAPFATSFTHWARPVVADVDADGAAEIVVLAGGNFALGGSVRVLGADAWPPARPAWSHHDFATTLIEDDGTVPARPAPWWVSPNCFAGQVPTCACGGPVVAATGSVACGTTVACLAATVAGGRAPHEVTWDFHDGSPPGRGIAACRDAGAPGTVAATVTVVDADGCEAASAVTVAVPEPLVAGVSHAMPCPNDPACFDLVIGGGVAPHAVTWNLGTTPVQSGVLRACAVLGAGTHDVIAYVEDATGCVAEWRRTVVVGAPPADVGPALRVDRHGDPEAATVTARLAWPGDVGLPRAAGESYLLLRGTAPASLARIPGTSGHVATEHVDGTPRAATTPLVHYYRVLAEDACGVTSTD